MEKGRSRYTILGLSDGLFVGLGLSLGISFFHTYSLTFASVLLGGITNALSNMFATYNAETFTANQQLLEYKEALFLKEYNPRKLADSKRRRSARYAAMSFMFTLAGSLIVLAPYAAFYFMGQSGIFPASLLSLAITLSILGIMGAYHKKNLSDRIRSGLKTVGIGVLVASLSVVVGFAVSYLV